MSYWLKQSTAVNIQFGPFLDEDDGKVAETGLAIAQADIRLSKNGANIAQSNNGAGASHDELGFYVVPLDTTDTNTLGSLLVAVHESGALPVFQYFMVVPANVWDSMFGADKLEVDATLVEGGDATDALTAATTASLVTHQLDHLMLTACASNDVTNAVNDQTALAVLLAADGDISAFNDNNHSLEALRVQGDAAWATATGFSTHTAANVWAVATRVLTANTNFNDPTAATIADAVWDELSTGHVSTGKAGEQLWTDVDAILDDTGSAGVVVGSLGAGSITAATFGTDAIDANAVKADMIDLIWDEVMESTLTARQIQRVKLAVLAGLAAGGGSTSITFRDVADGKNRVAATVDSDGNRTAITLDGS